MDDERDVHAVTSGRHEKKFADRAPCHAAPGGHEPGDGTTGDLCPTSNNCAMPCASQARAVCTPTHAGPGPEVGHDSAPALNVVSDRVDACDCVELRSRENRTRLTI